MFFRLLNPDSRFIFRNLYLDEGETYDLWVSGGLFGGHAITTLTAREGKIHAAIKKGNTLINDQALDGERALDDGDKLTLKNKNEDSFVLQLDPGAAKQTRLEQEKAEGIERELPDLSGTDGYVKKVSKTFSVGKNGIGLNKTMGNTQMNWTSLDSIRFVREESGGGGLVGAMVGSMIDSESRARGQGEFDDLFGNGRYTIRFEYKDKAVDQVRQIQARSCVLLAQQIEYYSPIDLINLRADFT